MKIGFIGLGRMGNSMVMNLLEHKHKVVGYNRSPGPTRKLTGKKGFDGAYSLKELVERLGNGRKVVWLMISAGKPVDMTLKELVPLLKRGDIVIDGGNSFFEDSVKRGKEIAKKRINYLDCGTSGGMEGARHGACMMIGGDKKAFRKVEVLFRDMCVKDGYGYMGKSGAGHFVKMVHNGIEYGMMGAINEGFHAIKKHKGKFGIDVKEVARVYAHGSIIEGKLMSWLYGSFTRDKYLDNISCEVPKGETEDEMKKLTKMADMRVLKESIKMRERSRSKKVCGDFISAMRNEFGGHAVGRKKR
jgi:6-phosphogluconate dehydrogenase